MDLLELGTIKRQTKSSRRGRKPDEDILVVRMGRVLLEREKALGLSRTEFARYAGLSRQTLYEIHEGTANLRLLSIAAVAEKLEMSIYELLGVPSAVIAQNPDLARVRKATSSFEDEN